MNLELRKRRTQKSLRAFAQTARTGTITFRVFIPSGYRTPCNATVNHWSTNRAIRHKTNTLKR